MRSFSEVGVKPDWEGFLVSVTQEGLPKRVHVAEIFIDPEVLHLINDRFGIGADLSETDPQYALKLHVATQRFLGYDYVSGFVEGLQMPINTCVTRDSALHAREKGRSFVNSRNGPITNWEEFGEYPWPDLSALNTTMLEWYEANLPDDMCVVGCGLGHFAEQLTWVMGYETLCTSIFTQPDLVRAISDRLLEAHRMIVQTMLQFSRVKVIWAWDDMGFKTGPMLSPEHLREYVLPGHRMLAGLAHAAGRPYLLHSCGKIDKMLSDFVEMRLDGKHSFEDVIEPVTEAKDTWGRHMSLIGGLDVDFMCRSSEQEVRHRVRKTLEKCLPGGGYVLGTGNSVTNYMPPENYLAMLDEGRLFFR